MDCEGNISVGNGSICVGTILASSQEQGLQYDVILAPDRLDPGELFAKSECQQWVPNLAGGRLIASWLSVSVLLCFSSVL